MCVGVSTSMNTLQTGMLTARSHTGYQSVLWIRPVCSEAFCGVAMLDLAIES